MKRNVKRTLAAVFACAVVSSSPLAATASGGGGSVVDAAAGGRYAAATGVHEDVGVFIGGEPFARDKCVIIDSVTRVPFRRLCDALSGGEAVIGWDEATQTASAVWRGMTITAAAGEPYILANGRALFCIVDNYVDDGVMMVAVRPLAKSFGIDVGWDGGKMEVSLTGEPSTIVPGGEFYDERELYWLSHIISAEARGEPLLGKLAVGAVVYNRVESDLYPDSIYDVIFDMSCGVQFTPAYSGSIFREPTAESVVAAKLCMEGVRWRRDVFFFCSKSIRYTSWAGKNRPYIATVANHVFFG